MMKPYFSWDYLVCGFLAIVVVAGGSSMPSRGPFMVLTFVSIVLLFAAVWRLRGVQIDQLTARALLILAAGFGLMFLQLVPLPQSLWSVMGSREFVADAFHAAKTAGVWQPLSLSPEATRQDILAVLPGVAMFVALLSTSRENQTYLAAISVGLALLGLLVGALDVNSAYARGSFINPNFFSAQIYMAIPFVLAFAMRSHQRFAWLIAALVILFCFVGIGHTGSRMGLFIACAVTLSCFIGRQSATASYALIGFAGLTVVILLFGGAGLDRWTGLQVAMAYRADMFSTSLQASISFLPAGSGFGSFVPIYQLFEVPQNITPSYVNHAHNDWLELVLEGGIPMAAILVSFVLWFGSLAKTVLHSESEFGRAALIAACAVLLHSLVDYPLRTPALLTVFALCCGLMLQSRSAARESVWQFEPAFAARKALAR